MNRNGRKEQHSNHTMGEWKEKKSTRTMLRNGVTVTVTLE